MCCTALNKNNKTHYITHLKWISEINKVKKKADVSLIDFVGIN